MVVDANWMKCAATQSGSLSLVVVQVEESGDVSGERLTYVVDANFFVERDLHWRADRHGQGNRPGLRGVDCGC